MANGVEQEAYGEQQFFSDLNTRIRDIEEKQRILRDRMILVSESFVKEREKNFESIQELKKEMEKIKHENLTMKNLLMRVAERMDKTARKEELAILQKQFDLFRD